MLLLPTYALIDLKVVDFNTKNCCAVHIECCSLSGQEPVTLLNPVG